ncbi:MAG: spore coat protein [Bacilli bacterium]|nr:spore coat protein [Bacilli bacterium]
MNNTQICNPKTEVPKGLGLTDKDYIEGILTVCKDLEKNLTVAMTEASNEKLYHTIFDMFTDIAELQRETYELWFKKGWFILEEEQKEKVNKKYNMLEQELVDLEVSEEDNKYNDSEEDYEETDEEEYSEESELDEIIEEEE